MTALARAQLQEFIALLDAGNTIVGGHNSLCVQDLGGSEQNDKKVAPTLASLMPLLTSCAK